MVRRKNTRRIQAIYSTIIFIIPSALIGGYFLGATLDEQFGTDPWLMVIGVFLGGTGAFVELFRVLNRGEKSGRKSGARDSASGVRSSGGNNSAGNNNSGKQDGRDGFD